ncbi:MAG: MBL fold metallo-hydrolase [Candidatus Thermoplasmatota archaeon]|nr:MBL fold metallo-hydrolase [Candidatus Thermoplasmatota archaeon]
MRITCICGCNYDSNIYVVLGKIPTIIDSGTGQHSADVEEGIKKILNPVEIKQIVLTHEHYDHCGGVKKLHDLTEGKAKIIAYKEASKKIEKGESLFAKLLGGVMPKIPVDVKLSDGDVVKIGDESFEVIYTPGHTPGSMCLYSKESKSLISGDTIFPHGSFGRYDLPGGNSAHLKKSIERLSEYDINNLYPGHETIVEGNADEHVKLTLKNIKYML